MWDLKKGKKHAELGWEPPNNLKYLFKRVKFGAVEGDMKKYKGELLPISLSFSLSYHSFLLSSSLFLPVYLIISLSPPNNSLYFLVITIAVSYQSKNSVSA